MFLKKPSNVFIFTDSLRYTMFKTYSKYLYRFSFFVAKYIKMKFATKSTCFDNGGILKGIGITFDIIHGDSLIWYQNVWIYSEEIIRKHLVSPQ